MMSTMEMNRKRTAMYMYDIRHEGTCRRPRPRCWNLGLNWHWEKIMYLIKAPAYVCHILRGRRRFDRLLDPHLETNTCWTLRRTHVLEAEHKRQIVCLRPLPR